MPSIKLTAQPAKYRKGKKNQRPKKAVEAAGILQDVRRKEYYEKPTAKRKRKKAEAIARHKRQVDSMQQTQFGRRKIR